jgi:hypothetical protein
MERKRNKYTNRPPEKKGSEENDRIDHNDNIAFLNYKMLIILITILYETFLS